MINNNYKHSELTSKIIGCAMKVHSALGNGFQELIYREKISPQSIDFDFLLPNYSSFVFIFNKNNEAKFIF